MKKNLSLEKIKEERKKSRIDKISSLIKKTIAEIFLTQHFSDSNGKDIIIFVSNVFLSGDGRVANVSVETLKVDIEVKEKEILSVIEENSVKIRKEFSKKIKLRYTPKLRFQLQNPHKIET